MYLQFLQDFTLSEAMYVWHDEENPKSRAVIHEYCKDKSIKARTIYSGTVIWKCVFCDAWINDSDTKSKNEYEEDAKILGFNPPLGPLLNTSDCYFDCPHCYETNRYSGDDYPHYKEIGRLKVKDYKPTHKMLIVKVGHPYKHMADYNETFRKFY
jgi:hypothetical protein